ncbi:nucleotide sugar dehydrogenase [Halarchaeum sp. P4]|uniref:nucleotide sugar dehydrogenase n=1 Tax=Halarchaeum sp. P4 TaxID=3421639 RepID=UPI003EB94680
MTVAVYGLGHIGLPTALLLAQDHDVVGVDVDPERVANVRAGDLPIDEPGVDDLYADVQGSFRVTTEPEPADAHVIVTPTPLEEATDVPDLRAVRSAAESVADVLRADDLVVLESTVPPGTGEGLVIPILESSGLDAGEFSYAHCPERAIPGRTLVEMVENHRVVGVLDDNSLDRTLALYSFVEGEVHATGVASAEFVKLMENTHRDVNIALANEFARMAEELGVDVHKARDLANEHPRVDVLRPGPGVGGHCITVDPQFLAQRVGSDRLISLARDVNESMVGHAVRSATTLLGEPPATLTVLGVAYKGGVADTRRTPALPLLRRAQNAGYDVRVHDPHVESFAVDPEPLADAAAGSDCLAVVTDHDAYESLDPDALAERMATPRLLDTRNVVDAERWRDAGFTVRTLGDGTSDPSM